MRRAQGNSVTSASRPTAGVWPATTHFCASWPTDASSSRFQFDGLDRDNHTVLRGADLLDEKLRLVDAATRLGARMSLTATIARSINDQQPSRILPLLFERENILSVMFQPAAYCGRGAGHAPPGRSHHHPRCDPELKTEPAAGWCPHATSHRCRAVTRRVSPWRFYLKTDSGRFVPIKSLIAADRYLEMIQNRALLGTDAQGYAAIKDAVYDLWSGPAALVPDSQRAMAAVKNLLASIDASGLNSWAKSTAMADRAIKSIFIHHFMDRHTFDLARARKCCQVVPPAGRPAHARLRVQLPQETMMTVSPRRLRVFVRRPHHPARRGAGRRVLVHLRPRADRKPRGGATTAGRRCRQHRFGWIVRTPGEFAEHHVDGALNWPLESIRTFRAGDSLRPALAGRKVLVICASGGRSASAARHLIKAAGMDAVNVRGGRCRNGSPSAPRPARRHGGKPVPVDPEAAGLPFHAASVLEQWVAVLGGVRH